MRLPLRQTSQESPVGESNKKELTGVPVFWDAIGGVYVCPVPEGERPERYVISVADYEAYDALQSQLDRETQSLASLTQQRDGYREEIRMALFDLTVRTDFKTQADRLLYIERNLRAALTPAQEAQT
jgi:hypothetical protein